MMSPMTADGRKVEFDVRMHRAATNFCWIALLNNFKFVIHFAAFLQQFHPNFS